MKTIPLQTQSTPRIVHLGGALALAWVIFLHAGTQCPGQPLPGTTSGIEVTPAVLKNAGDPLDLVLPRPQAVRYVRLLIQSNFGNDQYGNFAGLSEVQFFASSNRMAGPITAKASSEANAEQVASKAVDGSGLSGAVHSTEYRDMWSSANNDVSQAWIQFDLGAKHPLDRIRIWNYNQVWEGQDLSNRGIRQAKVLASTDGITWNTLDQEVVFPTPPTPPPGRPSSTAPIYVLPSSTGEVTGWARDFTRSGNIDVNDYLTYVDRVRDDPSARFVVGEIITLLNMMHMRPDRYPETLEYIKQGRIEPAHAQFVGECEPNLSGGEALVRQGVEGLRWNREVLGFRPRAGWFWDNCGLHEQLAQIAAGLGLDALVYSRCNVSGAQAHWLVSPEGSKTLGICPPGAYVGWWPYTSATEPLRAGRVVALEKECGTRWGGAPRLVFAGGESSLCTPYRRYPSELFQQWKELMPEVELRFSTMNRYLEAIVPMAHAGQLSLPVSQGGWPYGYGSFWIQSPKTKQYFRRSEHALQSAEMLASISSLRGSFDYPSEALHRAWIALLINMGRATFWGCCVQSAVEDDVAWDARDRFEYVLGASSEVEQKGLESLLGRGTKAGVFNPANWPRNDAVKLRLPEGMQLKGVPCQPAGDGMTLCQINLRPAGTEILEVEPVSNTTRPIELPAAIENAFYTAVVDPQYGDVVSLKLKGNGQELLAGPANVIVADQNDPKKCQNESQAEGCIPRPERKVLMTSRQNQGAIRVTDGPVAITVEVESDFLGGGKLRRTTRFLKQSPRIDFTTELNDIPAIATVLADFPLAGEVIEVRRGVPYGFAHGHWGRQPVKDRVPAPAAITPTIRWSDYTLAGGAGVALLDQGLTGREIVDNRVALYLHHTSDRYSGDRSWKVVPSPWLSGKGRLVTAYALLAHTEPWEKAGIARRAWEFNCPPVMAQVKETAGEISFVRTSENLLLESMRREGDELELRLVECLGLAGSAQITVNLPHDTAALTDMVGQKHRPLQDGPTYRFDVRPQQIVTLRLKTPDRVAPVKAMTDWTPLVPEAKRARLYEYDPNLKGWAAQSGEFEWLKIKHQKR